MRGVSLFFSVFLIGNFVNAASWDNCPFGPGRTVKPTQRIILTSISSHNSINVDSDQILTITSPEWKKGDCEVQYQEKNFTADPNFLLGWNGEAELHSLKLVSSPFAYGLNAVDHNLAECPLNLIKLGQLRWDLSSVDRVITSCEPEDVAVVPRENDPSQCTPHPFKNHDLSNVTAWPACPVPHECSQTEEEVLYQVEHTSMEIDRLVCNTPHNPKREAMLRAKLKNEKEPMCLTKFKVLPTKIVVHHSALSPLMGPDVIQRSHTEYRSFADIGYHYVIAQTQSGKWRLFEGRPLMYKGAHAGAGLNDDSVGVVIAGNYHSSAPTAVNPTADRPLPPPEALILLEGIIKRLSKELPIQKIYTHYEIKFAGSGCSTECPAAGPSYMAHKISEKILNPTTFSQK